MSDSNGSERTEQVAWLAGEGIGGAYLLADYDENAVRFTEVRYGADGTTVIAVCQHGRYGWQGLAEVFCDGARDGLQLSAVVADNAGEWVRNRIADGVA